MSTNLFVSEPKFLERVRVALTNAETHTEIKPLLAAFGVDENKIQEGWGVHGNAKNSWELNQKEEAEKKISSNTYKETFKELRALFKRHRDLSLIFFKKNPEFLIRLGVKGNFPRKYTDFFDKSKEYYTAIQNNPDIQAQLLLCKITPEVVTECLSKLENVKSLRAAFDKETGEAQDATELKNDALLELKEWMEDFDIIAKIALYDKPQLLEVLGIFVRS